MEVIKHINSWDDKHIVVLDSQDFEFRAFTEYVEDALLDSNCLDYQDRDIIEDYGFEFWIIDHMSNAIATINEMIEEGSSVKFEFKPL